MLSVSNLSYQVGKRELFESVNIMFTPGNCYGVIGANGSGKSTFLKILSGELEPRSGEISITKGERISVLRQDQFAFDEFPVLETVIMGHARLYKVKSERDAIYAKSDFSSEDGIRASELESEFSELDGWNAEPEAAKLLSDLGIPDALHKKKMKSLEARQKVRVLLAQALFGNPGILLLDEPTNQLDVETRMWLEEFLLEFKNTAIVVSHDRHFLDQVCTHICDIDFSRIQLYSGNYSFWKESSELALNQRSDTNKKIEEKRAELQAFIARFSANASKSRQATSRKKLLEKLTLEDIKPSTRKYPHVAFQQDREAGNDILEVEHLSMSVEGNILFQDLSFRVNKGDRIAFVGRADLAKTVLFQVLTGGLSPESGTFKWGVSTSRAYFPKDHKAFFETDLNLIDWLRQFSAETNENFIRGFLGRMLFSGEETLKRARVLSGGEKVRCMLSRMMLQNANVLILDEPTDHLDLESIISLDKALQKFPGTVLFASQDHQFIQNIANRIIEISPLGIVDEQNVTFDDYLANERLREKRHALYPSESAANSV